MPKVGDCVDSSAFGGVDDEELAAASRRLSNHEIPSYSEFIMAKVKRSE